MRKFVFALCAVALFAGAAFGADHPPVGAVVVAKDDGKSMRHVGGGHFVEVAGALPAPGACICGPSCACAPGVCAGGRCPVQQGAAAYRPVYAPSCAGGSCGLPGAAYYHPAYQPSYYVAPGYYYAPQSGCPGGNCRLK